MNHRLEVLAELATAIAAKRSAAPELSYTAKLLSEGVEKCAKKLGEEAVEAALAAVSGSKPNLAAEAADVLYHLIVLLEAVEVPLADVMAELERRKGVSGIAEKSARKQV
jgi:phosphoribosyl-ATP pyrophosphohydrolase